MCGKLNKSYRRHVQEAPEDILKEARTDHLGGIYRLQPCRSREVIIPFGPTMAGHIWSLGPQDEAWPWWCESGEGPQRQLRD